MFAPQLNQSFTQACYPIDNHAHILSEIYQTNAALACYCSAANWALSQAAKKFASQQHGEVLRYQGAVNNDLASNIDSIFQTSTHGNLITNHVMLMLDMFVTLFEPKEIGLRIISCDHAHSPAFHQNQMIVRMPLVARASNGSPIKMPSFYPCKPQIHVIVLSNQTPQ
jgi:hypothetical protein